MRYKKFFAISIGLLVTTVAFFSGCINPDGKMDSYPHATRYNVGDSELAGLLAINESVVEKAREDLNPKIYLTNDTTDQVLTYFEGQHSDWNLYNSTDMGEFHMRAWTKLSEGHVLLVGKTKNIEKFIKSTDKQTIFLTSKAPLWIWAKYVNYIK